MTRPDEPKGFDGVSAVEVCRAAGVAKGTLLHFFPTKSGALRAIVVKMAGLALAVIAGVRCGGRVVVDGDAAGGDAGAGGSGQAVRDDCEVIAEHLFALGCVTSVQEQVASCLSDAAGSCSAENATWKACYAANVTEVTSCAGTASSPPSCDATYCPYCKCRGGGTCAYDFCK